MADPTPVGEGIVDALRVIIDRVNELEREKVLLQQACALRAEQRDLAIRERDVLRLTEAKAGRMVDELQLKLAAALAARDAQ